MASRTPRGFSFETLRLPLAALGIFGLLAGLGAWLVQGDFSLVPRILVAAGVLLLGIYVALDPEDVWAKLTGRSALYSGNTLVIAAGALVILGLINVVGSRYQTKVDLTASHQFTLSDQSIKVAQALPAPVKVTAFLSANDTTKQAFQTLLNDYQNRSGGKLTYEFIDPVTHPSDAQAAGITAVPTIIYQMGDKKQNSTATTEKDITTALVKLERPEKKAYFTTGHGERALDGFNDQDYSSIKQALTGDNFTTAPLNLVTARTVPDDAAEVIVGGPTNPFMPEEKDALKAYLDGGGKVVLLIGPGSKTDLNDILQPYGVGFTGNTVVDPAKSIPQDARGVVIDGYGTHTITTDLRDLTLFLFSTSITYPNAAQGAGNVTVLAQTSDQSFASTAAPTPGAPIQQQSTDPKGPLAVAVAVGPSTASSAPASTPTPTNTPRLVLIGSPDLISNQLVQRVPGNQTFFLNAANWAAEEDNLINIRAPDTTQHTMVLTNSQMNLVAYSSFLFLPLAVLAAGAAVWWTRR